MRDKLVNVYDFTKDLTTGMYHSARNRTNESILDYTTAGCTFGALGGGVLGLTTGAVLPGYIGWKLADYLGDKIDLGFFLGTSADIVGVAAATVCLIGISAPILGIAGAVVGGATGAATGTVVGAGKKGLEAITTSH